MNKHVKRIVRSAALVALTCIMGVLAGCSPTRHVPDGSYLLDDVKIAVNDSTRTLQEQTMMTLSTPRR